MYRSVSLVILILLFLSAAVLGSAETDDDEFSLSLGAAMIVSPRPYVGSDAAVFPVPVVEVEYKRFFFQGIRGGFNFLEKGALEGNVFGQVQFMGLEPEDSDFLQGMEPRRTSADAGLEFLFRGRPVGFRAALLTDVLGRSGGQEMTLAAVSGFPLGDWLFLASFGPRWLSSDRVDYYYGVRPGEVRAVRPLYLGEATWNWELGLTARWEISDRFSLFTLFLRDGFGDEIQESPIIDQGASYGLITSLTYRIW